PPAAPRPHAPSPRAGSRSSEPAGTHARSRVVPSAAAPPPPVRCERSMPASSIPQMWYTCTITLPHLGTTGSRYYTDLRKFLDTRVFFISGHGSIAGTTYRAGEAGAQATAQSERIRRWLVANRFQAVSQASMMSARLRNTELASQWLRR